MRRHHMKDVLCTQGWVLKERVIERRSMTSRHHGELFVDDNKTNDEGDRTEGKRQRK